MKHFKILFSFLSIGSKDKEFFLLLSISMYAFLDKRTKETFHKTSKRQPQFCQGLHTDLILPAMKSFIDFNGTRVEIDVTELKQITCSGTWPLPNVGQDVRCPLCPEIHQDSYCLSPTPLVKSCTELRLMWRHRVSSDPGAVQHRSMVLPDTSCLHTGTHTYLCFHLKHKLMQILAKRHGAPGIPWVLCLHPRIPTGFPCSQTCAPWEHLFC